MFEDRNDPERLQKIRERAYLIWLDQGQFDGRDLQHWQEAELQLDREASPRPVQKPKKSKSK